MSLTIIRIRATSFTDFSQKASNGSLGFQAIPPSEVLDRGRRDADDRVGTDELAPPDAASPDG